MKKATFKYWLKDPPAGLVAAWKERTYYPGVEEDWYPFEHTERLVSLLEWRRGGPYIQPDWHLANTSAID